MRCIVRVCVIAALGSLAWTMEMTSFAAQLEYQVPAGTVTSTVTQATGTVVTPVGVYQGVTSQPATTTILPGTTIVGAQPVTTYGTPVASTPYTAYAYPVTVRRGLFGRSTVYMYPAMSGTTTYSTPVQSYTTPVQTYSVVPGQTYYQPVRRGFGPLQSWGLQSTPIYGNAVYSTSGYSGGSYYYSAPVYTTYDSLTPGYYYSSTSAPPTTTTVLPTTTTSVGSSTPAPVYTPTMLNVPNTTVTTIPAGSPIQGATPAQATPSAPAVGQGSGAVNAPTPPPVPSIPRRNPG